MDIYFLDACVIEKKKLYWEKDILMLTSMSKFWQSAQTNSVQQCGINPKSFFPFHLKEEETRPGFCWLERGQKVKKGTPIEHVTLAQKNLPF